MSRTDSDAPDVPAGEAATPATPAAILTDDPLAAPTAVAALPSRYRRGPSAVGQRMVTTGFDRVALITANLVGTQAVTSVLGFLYWTLAARRFSASAVGLAGAATSTMQLLGSVGMLGMGTLLISRLFAVDRSLRRLLVRSALLLVGVVSAFLGLGFALAVQFIPSHSLRPLGATPEEALLFAVGVAATGVTLVLDQAVLAIGSGRIQLERNLAASATKLVCLLGLSVAGAQTGMSIYLSWTIGTIASMTLTVWRTRGGRAFQASRRIFDLHALRGLGREAASHHVLNLALQAPLMVLSPIIALEVSTTANGYFSTVILVAGFVFVLPFAISIGLFAAAKGDSNEVLRRMRLTVPVGILSSLAADLILFPAAPLVLHAFGKAYASQGADSLRIIVLAGLPFVIKDHFVALRRVQRRTAQAARSIVGTAALEVVAAVLGARADGVNGLCGAWVGVLFVEGVLFGVPLLRAYRRSVAAGRPHAAESVEPTEARAPERRSPLPPALERRRPEQKRPDSGAPTGALAVRATSAPSTDRSGAAFFLASVGLLVEALASVAGSDRVTPFVPDLLAWVGLVLIVAPPAAVILHAASSRRARISSVLTVGVALQVSRFMLFPAQFVFHDELAHANTLRVLERSHHLFGANPLLPVSSSYPGLEVATDALHNLTGLSDRPAAGVLLVLVRAVMTLAILLGLERITHSLRLSAAAALLYVCNEQYLFFNSQFSYQTLALPLALLCVYLLVRRFSRQPGPTFTKAAVLPPLAVIAATTVTHHLTSMLLGVALLAWWLIERRLHRHSALERALRWCWPASLLAAGAWLLRPGNPAQHYLGSIIDTASAAVTGFLGGRQSHRLFADPSGYVTPEWEVVVSLASELALVAALLLAARLAWTRRRRRVASLSMLLALLALAYPVIPAGHVTGATAEITDRGAGFIFLGTAFLLGAWLLEQRAWLRGRRFVVVAAAVVVLFVGQALLGSGPQWAQTPGSFLVSADSRSIDGANLAAARWEASYLDPGSRVLADRDAGLLAGYVGHLSPVTHVSTNVDASAVLLAPGWTPHDLDLVRRLGIEYVVVDERDANGLPREGVYYESGEYDQARTSPVSAAALDKLSTVKGVQRVYDNGALIIYDLRALLPR